MAENVIIVGSGPAGLTAALYTARADLKPLVLEGGEPGGQLTTTTDVENYPGFPEAQTGPELIERMHQQAERFGAGYLSEEALSVDFSSRPYQLKTDQQTLEAKTIIVASGASARWLGLESEQQLRGKGVSACATCDGFFFRDKDVVVVGGGDSAMEEALFLTRFCSKVSIIHRRDALRASKIMQDRALNHKKIEMVWNSVVREVMDPEAGKVTGVKIENVETGEISELACQGMFLGIGHNPNTGFLKDALVTDDNGFIRCKGRGTSTNVEGVFAAGDVMDPYYKQAVTAAGTGCMAAIEAEKYLEAQD